MDVVNRSAHMNTAQMVGTQSREVIVHVHVYDWAIFLGDHFQKVAQIKSYHPFTFSSPRPGTDSEGIFRLYRQHLPHAMRHMASHQFLHP